MNHFKIFSFMFKGRKTHVQKHAISQSDTAVCDIYSLRGTEVRALIREVVLTIALPRPPIHSWWEQN